MKKLLALALTVITLCAFCLPVSAASDEATSAADSLHALGLFNGTGSDAEGNPIYDLDRTPTRHEAVTMLVRLLGKEDEANSGTWITPFTDVDDWAKPYIGYAYTNGLTTGTSATTFSGQENVTASQYITLVLRALGYSDNDGDFEWNKAWGLSDRIGLTDGRFNANSGAFLRGDVAIVSYSALACRNKGSNNTLARKLYATSVIDYDSVCAANLSGAVDVTVLNVPKNLYAVPGFGQVTIHGTEVADSTGYEVFYSLSENGSYEYLLFSTGFGKSGIVVRDLTGMETYYFKIRSSKIVWNSEYNAYENLYSSFSAPIMAKPANAIDVSVETPIITGADVAGTNVTLKWRFDTSVDYYSIYRNGILCFECPELYTDSYTFTGLEPNTKYTFSIVATKIVSGQYYQSEFSQQYETVTGDTSEALSANVTISNLKYAMDSVGGVTWTFDLTNNSSKTIKYVTLRWNVYNAVGDKIYDSISGGSFAVMITGPIESGETEHGIQNTRKFYNYSYKGNIGQVTCEVEYMDGTRETINSGVWS